MLNKSKFDTGLPSIDFWGSLKLVCLYDGSLCALTEEWDFFF